MKDDKEFEELEVPDPPRVTNEQLQKAYDDIGMESITCRFCKTVIPAYIGEVACLICNKERKKGLDN